jgi:putative NIF3 family GTP cyclohydrolase 1 type 2
MGLEPEGSFAEFKGREIGWMARADLDREELKERVAKATGGEVRLIPGGREVVRRTGVVTGGGASSLREAASRGLDALVTGEAQHQHYHEAMELGINLYLAGHYATETFGVKAVGAALADSLGVEWEFLDFPTGL